MSMPKIGNMIPLMHAAIVPIVSTGISGLLRYASLRIETSGISFCGGETSFFSWEFSVTLIPVGKPNDTENEWRLLFPTPDDSRLMDRCSEIL